MVAMSTASSPTDFALDPWPGLSEAETFSDVRQEVFYDAAIVLRHKTFLDYFPILSFLSLGLFLCQLLLSLLSLGRLFFPSFVFLQRLDEESSESPDGTEEFLQ